jgi:peptidoglycan/xylan/chitin deacetylase (PgdA/CDA1 family)
MVLDTVRVGAALYYHGLRAIGATSLCRLTKNAGLILCYHNVVWREDEHTGDPSLHMPSARFERQMTWLVDNYDVVSLTTFVDRLEAGASLTETAAVTFDDGYAGVFDYAVPVLDALSIPATVFVIADAPGRSTGFWWDTPEVITKQDERRERWLTDLQGDEDAILTDVQAPGPPRVPAVACAADWSAIRLAARGHIDIGVHSATHRALPALNDQALEAEIAGSRLIVQRAIGTPPEFFSYPYGLWDARSHDAVRRAGYRAAFALSSGLNDHTADPFALRRVNVPGTISAAAFDAWTAGFHLRRT